MIERVQNATKERESLKAEWAQGLDDIRLLTRVEDILFLLKELEKNILAIS